MIHILLPLSLLPSLGLIQLETSHEKNIYIVFVHVCSYIYICICFCTGCTVYQHDTTFMSNAYDASTASIVGVKTSWETTSRQPTAGEARGGRLFSKSTIRFPLRSKDLEAFLLWITLCNLSCMKCLFLSLLIKIFQNFFVKLTLRFV